MKQKRKGPFALKPDRFPIPDLKHANLAVTRCYMKTVTKEDARAVVRAIKKRFKSPPLMERIKKLELKRGLNKMAKKKKKAKTKRKTTKKGNRRKGQPKGARLAYDDLKKRKKRKATKKKKNAKKKARRKSTAKKSLLDMLTDALPS